MAQTTFTSGEPHSCLKSTEDVNVAAAVFTAEAKFGLVTEL
jgi:hypothetical protein